MRPTEMFHRQLEVLPIRRAQETPVMIIGCGAIGSWAAVALAKTGVEEMSLYDGDLVEPHNLPMQLYGPDDLYAKKSFALSNLLRRMCGIKPTIAGMWREGEPLTGVVVVAVDSLKVRREIWEGCKRDAGYISLVIDARMGAEVCQIFTALPPGDKAYEESLQGEPFEAPCSARSTAYAAALAASLVGATLARWWRDEVLAPKVTVDLHNFLMLPTNGMM